MEKYWLENIYYTIKGFANFDRQRTAWRGLDKNVVSSYIEDYNLLYFSFDFEDFITAWKNEKHNNTILIELIEFNDMLNNYDKNISEEMKLDDMKILDDPNWINIVNQAKRIVEMWKL